MQPEYDVTLDPRHMFNPALTSYRIVRARGSRSGLHVTLSDGTKGTIPWRDFTPDDDHPVGLDSFGPYEIILLFRGQRAGRCHVDLLHTLLKAGGRAETERYLRTHEVVVGRALKVFRGILGWSAKVLASKSGLSEARLAEVENGAFASFLELAPVMEALQVDYPMLRLAELSAGGEAPVRVVDDPGPKAA